MRDVSGDKGIHRQGPLEVGYVASAGGGHTRAETVTALVYKLARLIGPLHDKFSAGRAVPERALEGTPKSAMKTRKSLGSALDLRGL